MEIEQSQNEYIDIKNKVTKYNYLFHKFILNIYDPDEDIDYNIIQNIKSYLHHRLVIHIHCYKTLYFNAIYGKYINSLKKKIFCYNYIL